MLRCGTARSARNGLDGENVSVGVAAPGGADVAHPCNAVLSLQIRQVVVLELDAALAQRGYRRVEVADAEAVNGVPALARAHALISENRAVPAPEFGFAVLRKIFAPRLQLETKDLSVELCSAFDVRHRNDCGDFSISQHVSSL